MKMTIWFTFVLLVGLTATSLGENVGIGGPGEMRSESQDLEFTADGKYLAAQVSNLSLALWELPSGKQSGVYTVPKPYIVLHTFYGDLPDYVTRSCFDVSGARTRLMIETATGRLGSFEIRGRSFRWLGTLDGRATLSYGHCMKYGHYIHHVHVFSTVKQKIVAELDTRGFYYHAAKPMGDNPAFDDREGRIGDLAISPIKRFVAVSMPGTVLLWDLKTGGARLL